MSTYLCAAAFTHRFVAKRLRKAASYISTFQEQESAAPVSTDSQEGVSTDTSCVSTDTSCGDKSGTSVSDS